MSATAAEPPRQLRLDGLLAALARQRLVRPLRAVLEIRHPSWLTPPVFERLRRAGVAICLSDWPEAPVADVLTADFVYIRRHRPSKRYGSRYTDAALGAEADRIRRWLERGHDVYVYFRCGSSVPDARPPDCNCETGPSLGPAA